MSDCAAPDWNPRQQRLKQAGGGDGTNRSSHVQIHQIHPHHCYFSSSISKRDTVMHMRSLNMYARSNRGVAELIWENGQLAMHGHGPLKPLPGSSDTLESIVHQATCHKKNPSSPRHDQPPPPSTGGILDKSHARLQCPVNNYLVKKRKRSDSKPDHVVKENSGNGVDGGTNGEERSICGGGSRVEICRDDEVTMRTWASFETPATFKTKTTDENGSASHGESENQDEDGDHKGEIGPSQSTRRSRASTTHNLSEQRRRDRINEKMKALQRLVPNASKTDKASMLDEVIDYLKQLQAQVQMMSLRNNMPQMILPSVAMHQQQQLQMSLLAARAAGVGLGMLDINPMAAFVPQPYMVPPLVATQHFQAQANPEGRSSAPVLPVLDPYCAYLAHNMNMEHFNKMAALHRQQVHQTAQASRPSRSNRKEGK